MSDRQAIQQRSLAGLLPWAVWGLGALFYCYGFFQRVAPSVMVGELMRDFAVGATITGVLSSLYFYTYAGLQIPIGLLLDTLGPRRLLTAATALCAAGSALFAMAPDLWVAYAGRLLIGAGAAVSWVGALTLASQWFPPHRFALVTGLTMAIGMTGAVGGQAPLGAAVSAVGWRGTMWLAAAVGLALTLAMWLVVRDRARPAAKPEEGMGLMDGLRAVLRTPQTYVASLYGLTIAAPMLALAGLWGVPYMMQTHGLERSAAAFSMSLMLVGWGVGAPLAGWFSDRIGRRKLPMLLNGGGAVVTLAAALYLPLPLPVQQALFFVNGVFAGGMVVTFATARENNLSWASGATLGVVNMSVMSSGAIFQPLIGWLLDRQWAGELVDGVRVYPAEAWDLALLVLPGCHLVTFLMALLVRETFCHPTR